MTLCLARQLSEGSNRERLHRFALGNPGDARPVGAGVMELRIDYGPGYRVYYTRRGNVVVIMLCGGDKGSKSAISVGRKSWRQN